MNRNKKHRLANFPINVFRNVDKKSKNKERKCVDRRRKKGTDRWKNRKEGSRGLIEPTVISLAVHIIPLSPYHSHDTIGRNQVKEKVVSK